MSEEQKNTVEEAQAAENGEALNAEQVAETVVDENFMEADNGDSLNVDAIVMAKQLADAQEEIASLKDQLLRTVAEAQNTKRRAEQDVTKAHKFGTEKFVNEMLPIVDSLDRALESCADDESTKALREGVEMTLSMFISGLAKFNVELVDPQGTPFDPALHQAMSMVDGGDAPSNTVIAVMQKGFTISGRLLRPAMVMVAK